MPTLLTLSTADLDDESLHELTRGLCRDLCDEALVEASLAEQSAGSGAKGDLAIIGQILITAAGAGGALVALINVLKAYVERKPSLQFEFQKQDGSKVTIKADDLRGGDMTKLVQTIEKAFGEK